MSSESVDALQAVQALQVKLAGAYKTFGGPSLETLQKVLVMKPGVRCFCKIACAAVSNGLFG